MFRASAQSSLGSFAEWISGLFANTPSPVQHLATTVILGIAVLCVLLTGLILDLLSPMLVKHEAPILGEQLKMNEKWFAKFASHYGDYLSAEDIEAIKSSLPFWKTGWKSYGPILNPLKWPPKEWKSPLAWIAKLIRAYLNLISFGDAVTESKKIAKEMNATRRLHALFLAYVTTDSGMKFFGEEFYLWHACRAFSVALGLLTIETTIVLMWRWVSLVVPSIHNTQQLFLREVFLALGIEFLGLSLSAYFGMKSYRKLVVSLFAITYVTFSKEMIHD